MTCCPGLLPSISIFAVGLLNIHVCNLKLIPCKCSDNLFSFVKVQGIMNEVGNLFNPNFSESEVAEIE